MISRRIWNQLTRRKKPFSQPTKSLYRQKRGLRFEPLELRQMLSVSLGTLPNIQVPGGTTVLVPLTGADSDGEPITYSFQSSDSNVTLSLVSPGGHNLALTVSGTDGAGNPFNGTMVIHLFDDLAPNTASRIEQLVGQGFYNGLPFTRVLDGFVAQGGDNGTGGTGQTIDDEFNSSLTFNSPGLLAMANRGDDTSDSQFFITAIDGAGSTNPIALANMPQFLNFNYSIFGQLVSGFDTFEKIMSTQVQLNNQTGETSQPVNPITISSAQLINDNHDGVLSVFAPASFDGSSATITVTATNSDGLSTQQQFTAAAVTDTQVDPPFLGPISNQVTTTGTPDVFALTTTDLEGAGVTYFVVDPNTGGTPNNATISIDQSTGQVTVSPTPGFSGTIDLLAAVRAASASNDISNFDTQLFTVTVLPPPTLGPVTNLTTSFGTQTGLTLTSTDTPGAGVAYAIGTTDNPSGVVISIDQQSGEVLIMPVPGFTGTAHLLAGVRSLTSPDVQSNYDIKAFTVTVEPPVINPVDDVVTTIGTPKSITLTSDGTTGSDVVFNVVDADTNLPPTDVSVDIDPATGIATLHPTNGFTGTVHLLAGVRASSSPDVPESYSTDAFTLTVNPPPTLGDVSDLTTVVGAPVHFTLHADDPAGAGFFYTVVDASTFAPPGVMSVTVNQATGEVTLSPLPGFTGTFNLRAGVRAASDPDVESSYDFKPFTLTINPGPTLEEVSNVTTTVGTPVGFDLHSTDPNGTGVFYQVIDPETLGSPTLIHVNIDQATGHVILTPVPGVTGTFTLLAGVRATTSFDIQADYSTQSFTITVGAGPAIGQVNDKSTVVGAPISFDLTSTNAPAEGVFYELVDPTTHGAPQHVTVQIDHATGHVTLTPDNGFTGPIQLLAGVRGANALDVPADYSTQTFNFTVGAGPTLGAVADQTTTAGNANHFTLTSTNANGQVFYEIVDPTTHGAPANVTVNINQTTGEVTLTPAAGFTGTINLLAGVRSAASADDQANFNTDPFTLTVTAAAISLAPLHDIQVPGGKSVLVPLTGTDSAGNPITYTFSSSDSNVTLQLVSQASKSLKLNVSGIDKNGNPFTGTIILHLFEDLTPIATQRIKDLVSQSFFNGKQFFRVLDGFVAQSNGDSALGNFNNEIVPSLTFNSPGLLSFANAGAGTNNSEIFITAIDNKGSSDPITLANMPQFLNNNFTILGQLVSGFDTFEKIMTVPVQASSNFNGEVSSPVNPITITSAEIITDTQDAVLRVSAPASFNNNSSTITVTATNSQNQSTQQTFHAAVVVNPPSLGSVSNQTTTATTPVSFTLTSTKNDTSVGVVYNIFDATTHAAPTNVSVNIDQATGKVTLTPTSGFTGTLNLLAGVRAATATDTFANFDAQPFTLTVTPNAALKPVLGPVSNQSTSGVTPVVFTLTSTDPGGNGVVYKVADATTFGNPANATVSINQTTGQVTITPNAGFTGTITLLAGVRSSTAADTQASYDTKQFTVTVNAASTTNPTLGPISDQVTQVGTPVSFTLTSTNPGGGAVVYKIVDPTTFGAPANVTININQSTGQVTLTPTGTFTGTINLLAEVRSAAADDVQANYTTQAFKLTVNASVPNAPINLIVDPSSNTGPFDGNGYISTNTPKLRVTAATGGTVKFKLNGVVLGNGTETASGSGQFTVTVPAGKLAIGSNTITASVTTTGGTSVDSTALALIYSPDFNSGVYVVPGAPGSTQQVVMAWTVRKARYNDELGYFVASSLDGSVNGVAPGDAGYAKAALSSSSRHIVFGKGETAGASSTIALQGGQIIVFYMIQNNTTGAFLANNPTNALHGNSNGDAPLAFFSIEAANPDGMKHTQIIADPSTGRVQYNWEDLVSLGDSDFNDVVMTVRLASQTAKPPATLHAPGAGSTSVTVIGSLGAGHQQSTKGDLGVFFVDNPDGSIGTLKPGDPGYAAAALSAGNSRVLFAAGAQAGGNQSVSVPAGKYLGFYIISNGTTDNFRSANAANSTGNGPVAMFSFDSANPDNTNHFRWYSPNQNRTDPSVQQLHIMDEVFGNESNFDDLTMNVDFSAGT